MVTSIDLGRIFTAGGRTVFGGSASGMDTEAIVNALVEARQIPITRVQDDIDANTEKLSAYSELQSILTRLQSAAEQLSNPPGFTNIASNAFAYVTGTVTSNTSVAGSSYLSVSASPGALDAEYTLTVDNLAEAKTETSTTAFASNTASVVEAAGGATAGMFSAGDITIDTPAGSPVTITLDAGDSLIDIAAKINNVSDTSGMQATIIMVSATDFRLQLQSTDTGVNYAYTITDDGSGVMTQVAFAATQAAEDASVTFNGIPGITRSSNSIDDLVEDVTFNLLAQTPGGTELTVSIDPDVETIVSSISNFIDVYNEFRLFAAQQELRNDDGTVAEGSVLAGDTTLTSIINQMAEELGNAVQNIVSGDPDSLDDIGITVIDFAGDAENPAVDNILSLDEDALRAALESDFDGVRRIFEFDMTSGSPDLTVFSRTNALSVYEFTLDIDMVGGTANATYDPGTGPVTVALDFAALTGGATISGVDGTPFEGLVLVYSDTVSDSIDVNITHGIADRMFNDLREFLDEDTGMLPVQVDSLADENTDLETEIDALNEALEEYRQQLLERFGALEQAIAQANTILQSLAAQSAAAQAS